MKQYTTGVYIYIAYLFKKKKCFPKPYLNHLFILTSHIEEAFFKIALNFEFLNKAVVTIATAKIFCIEKNLSVFYLHFT